MIDKRKPPSGIIAPELLETADRVLDDIAKEVPEAASVIAQYAFSPAPLLELAAWARGQPSEAHPSEREFSRFMAGSTRFSESVQIARHVARCETCLDWYWQREPNARAATLALEARMADGFVEQVLAAANAEAADGSVSHGAVERVVRATLQEARRFPAMGSALRDIAERLTLYCSCAVPEAAAAFATDEVEPWAGKLSFPAPEIMATVWVEGGEVFVELSAPRSCRWKLLPLLWLPAPIREHGPELLFAPMVRDASGRPPRERIHAALRLGSAPESFEVALPAVMIPDDVLQAAALSALEESIRRSATPSTREAWGRLALDGSLGEVLSRAISAVLRK